MCRCAVQTAGADVCPPQAPAHASPAKAASNMNWGSILSSRRSGNLPSISQNHNSTFLTTPRKLDITAKSNEAFIRRSAAQAPPGCAFLNWRLSAPGQDARVPTTARIRFECRATLRAASLCQ